MSFCLGPDLVCSNNTPQMSALGMARAPEAMLERSNLMFSVCLRQSRQLEGF